MFKIITKTDSIKVETLKTLLYGEPGIGKTSLSFTADKPLLLDFDRGMQRACYRLDGVAIESWEGVIAFQKSKELADFAPKTIICDTVGTMLDNYIADYVKRADPKNSQRGGELSLRGYGAMKNVFQQFLGWAISRQINLIFIAHLTEVKEGDSIKFVPKVTGGSYDVLRQTMDLIGYIESSSNRRVIDFAPRDRHIGKDCAELGAIEIPDYRKAEYRTFMQDVITRTLDRMNSLSDNQTEILQRLLTFEDGLTGLTGEKSNEILKEVIAEKDESLRLQMFHLLKSKSEKAGIVYNSKTKKFDV